MDKYIVFLCNSQSFAINIYDVERIIDYETPKRLPESEGFLMGVIKYNDSILPIIDINKRLYDNSAGVNERTKIIVALWKEKFVGLVVDDILGIYEYGSEKIETSNGDDVLSKEYISGFIKREDDITLVLDTHKLFTEEHEEKILSTVS